ncbi:hypothetical protein BU23DRAFT_73102 [Bimuria novae-zelandiae CBS 107.79]|uniref:SAP domain-containing protein n=1 Tax=Bimuria novae-zelandiae CBS 107.79 TaxID=1447943 RepID=A0A6A5VE19_9PLEO|nr:hypothetical protein BU23DRAFT_73102 [Bimuria novae-zelandiae CBS 107.79]
MSNYSKLKNDELQALLRERGLSAAGKKAEMVDRLTKDDEKKPTDAAPAQASAHPEDEIDWDDEDATADASKGDKPAETSVPPSAVVTEPDAVTKTKAGGTGQPPNPQTVPNQKADIDPSKTDDLSVKPPGEEKEGSAEAKDEEPKEPAPSYAAGLAATDLDAEIEKRKKRAEKFGLKVDSDETLKKLERAKKFGEVGPPKGLDEALPERERKERKRGRDDNEDSGRNKRRGGGRTSGNRGPREPREGRGGNRDGDRRWDNRRDDRRNDNGGNWMSAADRERAEARKAKWTKPAAAS